ncbi:MAG: ABC transporter permease [Polyangiaceae bacterium]|nr:ABC transporter permease [Polyangiaceae bacterium]
MNALRALAKKPWFGPLLALIVVYLLFLMWTPDTFARPITLITMARQTVVVGTAAVGMTLVILLGGIDLSVGSLVALTTVITARLLQNGMSAASAAMVGIFAATAIGAINGGLIVGLRVTPFLITLGTMSILRGAAKGLADEQKIDAPTRGLEMLMTTGPNRSWMIVPPGVWTTLLLAGIFAAVLHFTVFGKHAKAVGSNERTARLAGIQVGRIKVYTYAIAGFLAGIAGIFELSTLTVGDPTDSIGLELSVIASVVIGGGSLAGGQGSIVGALLGALLMTVIRTGSTQVGLPNWVQEILTGAIIIVATGIDSARQRKPA